MRQGFHDAWQEFFGPESKGSAFRSASQPDQEKVAEAYMDDLPKVGDLPTSAAPGIAARAWFACYLDKLAKGDKAGAERIRDTFR